jgi:hypothetical protein
MRRVKRIISLALAGVALKASHALAAGGAPWDPQ